MRQISLTFGGVSLEAGEYTVRSGSKLLQIPMANGLIKTASIGRTGVFITVKGKLPASDVSGFTGTFGRLIAASGYSLLLDGSEYTDVILDSLTAAPERSDGFASYCLEFHCQ